MPDILSRTNVSSHVAGVMIVDLVIELEWFGYESQGYGTMPAKLLHQILTVETESAMMV